MQTLRWSINGLKGTASSSVRRPGQRRGISRYMPPKEESRQSLTKIVATIGPASEQFEPLQQCVSSGMRVMRLNFSHATFEEATLRMTNLRKSSGLHSHKIGGHFNLRAVLLDIQGPKIRTGSFVDGAIEIEEGKQYTLTNDPDWKLKGTSDKFFVDYHGLITYSKPGHVVIIDDGNIVMRVTEVRPDAVVATAVNGGHIKNRRGVNLPDAIVDLPAITEKDKKDLRFGVQNDIDFVAASFVRKAQDIHDIRAYLSELMKEFWPDTHPAPKIIAKIESTEGLKNFEEILQVTDGIMVARGDLGVEIPVEEVTNMQKMMVRRCKLVGKPVIVATQMLESMQVLPRPTRAEVSDVTHAVYDGADAVMLSGESAQGKYPVESVATMRAIIEAAETWQNHNAKILGSNLFRIICDSQSKEEKGSNFFEASASSAVMAAERLQAKCIIVHTQSGDMARTVSKYCPSVPILVFTNSQKVARQLILHRGVHPIVIPEGHLWTANRDSVLEYVKKLCFCKAGDLVVVVTGEVPSKDADMSLGTYFLRIAP